MVLEKYKVYHVLDVVFFIHGSFFKNICIDKSIGSTNFFNPSNSPIRPSHYHIHILSLALKVIYKS